jgi:RND superfamily putative drug exporter
MALMFAFLVLSTSPGYEIKPLAIGNAAGIIFDATVIRALLVPALMRLFGDANWWMPEWTRIALRISLRRPPPRAPSTQRLHEERPLKQEAGGSWPAPAAWASLGSLLR